MGGGPTIDLAGTRTVKEILRVVHAKRLGVEIGRRFSATLDPTAEATAANSGTAAPAAAAATARRESSGKAEERTPTAGEGVYGVAALGGGHMMTTKKIIGSRHPFEKTLEEGGGGGGGEVGKIEAAAELLARVRGQLKRSEQRTEGVLIEGGGGIAPPR